MSVKLQTIMDWIEELAPLSLAESWDRTGLAVGDPASEISHVLVALDVIEPVIEEAKETKAELILTHHPMLLFRKIESIRKDSALGNRIYALIENGIAAYSAHTNLDIAKGGTNDVLAELIGLREVKLLEVTEQEEWKKIVIYVPTEALEDVRNAICGAGAGHIGNYSHCTFQTAGEGTFLPLAGTSPYVGKTGELTHVAEARLESIAPKAEVEKILAAAKAAHPYEEMAYDIYPVEQSGKEEGIGRIGVLPEEMTFAAFAKQLKDVLGLDAIRLVGDGKQKVKTVALCTGSGAEFLETAKQMGADVYLTGDIKYHEAQKAVEMGLCVADVTHYASEVLIVPILCRYLRQRAKQAQKELTVSASAVNGQTFWHI